MSDEQVNTKRDLATVMAQKLAMAYITASISNGYLEDSIEDMRKLGVLHRDVKQKANFAKSFFDNYNHSVMWFFDLAQGRRVGNAICEDYQVLQDACDRYMMSGIRLSAHEAWNNPDAREEGRYLCRVDGAKGTDIMLLEWKNRQWLTYVSSTVGAGWLALTPGVKVVEVVKRINAGDINPMEKTKQ